MELGLGRDGVRCVDRLLSLAAAMPEILHAGSAVMWAET